MQLQTQESQQKDIKASIAELNKNITINDNMSILRGPFHHVMNASASIHVVNSTLPYQQ